MREILYRGKPKNKEHSYFFSEIWKEHYEKGFVYGSLIVYKDRCFIAVSALCNIKHCVNNGLVSMIEVAPETVGQFTGLTDKNDIKIFEGDIVKGKDNLERNLAVGGYIDHENGSFVIVGEFMTHYRWLDYELEVIGNRYDDLELLRSGIDNG